MGGASADAAPLAKGGWKSMERQEPTIIAKEKTNAKVDPVETARSVLAAFSAFENGTSVKARVEAARGVGRQASELAVAFGGEAETLDGEKVAKELAMVRDKKKEETAAREAEQRRVRAAQAAAFAENRAAEKAERNGNGWLEEALDRSAAEKIAMPSRSRSRDKNIGFPSTRHPAELGMLGFSTTVQIKRRAASDKNPAHEGLDGIKAELLRERGLLAVKEKGRGDRSRSRDRRRKDNEGGKDRDRDRKDRRSSRSRSRSRGKAKDRPEKKSEKQPSADGDSKHKRKESSKEKKRR